MKNYLKLLALIAFALFIYACSNENNTNNENDSTTAQTEDAKGEKSDTEGSEAVEKYDFRRAKWGMSKQEVMESEEDEPALQSENTLDYSVFIMGIQTQVGYTFKDDKLIRAGFFFLTKPDTNNKYVDNYLEIKEELIKANGEPVIDAVKQKDPTKEIDPDNRGDAACNGDVIYASQWDLPATDIQLVLRGENSECILTILYISEEGMRDMLMDRLKK